MRSLFSPLQPFLARARNGNKVRAAYMPAWFLPVNSALYSCLLHDLPMLWLSSSTALHFARSPLQSFIYLSVLTSYKIKIPVYCGNTVLLIALVSVCTILGVFGAGNMLLPAFCGFLSSNEPAACTHSHINLRTPAAQDRQQCLKVRFLWVILYPSWHSTNTIN